MQRDGREARPTTASRPVWPRRGGPSLCWFPPCWPPVRSAGILLLALVFSFALVAQGTAPGLAQATDPPVGSRLRVANTEGQRLNLRAGPGPSEAVLTRLPEGTELEVVGAARAIAGVRWIEVREAGGQRGWISLEYAAVVSTPTPIATPAREPTPTPEAKAEQPVSAAPAATATPESTATPVGGPLDVEARVKFPETDGRSQTITVTVTRNGVPVPGVVVTAVSDDGEDDALLREFDPTNDEGRASKTFTIRREKGTVRVAITATAPDGGKGAAIVEYFRR